MITYLISTDVKSTFFRNLSVFKTANRTRDEREYGANIFIFFFDRSPSRRRSVSTPFSDERRKRAEQRFRATFAKRPARTRVTPRVSTKTRPDAGPRASYVRKSTVRPQSPRPFRVVVRPPRPVVRLDRVSDGNDHYTALSYRYNIMCISRCIVIVGAAARGRPPRSRASGRRRHDNRRSFSHDTRSGEVIEHGGGDVDVDVQTVNTQ